MSYSQEHSKLLVDCANALVQSGKGLLAADESTGTIKKRFDSVGIENTEENRSKYRELLFKAKGLEKSISGAILYEETLNQTASCGTKMVDLLTKKGIIPGIKVDKGVVNMPCTDGESATTGLDGLEKRCAEYYQKGARFTKWRAVITINKSKCHPSWLCIQETAHTLARYAAICQDNKLVPIVEPEVLTDGSHSIEECAQITERVLCCLVKELHLNRVLLEGCLLKVNMVTCGTECAKRDTPEEIAMYTVRTLKRTIPPSLAGVVFLSGGQSEEEASVNLNAINQYNKNANWPLTFSYGRALQASCIKVWHGEDKNIENAQSVLIERANANGLAAQGKYKGGVGGAEAKSGLHVTNYVY